MSPAEPGRVGEPPESLDVQWRYWDGAAVSKTFHHPVPLAQFQELVPVTAAILDYGCGYGRVCSELADAGYHNVVGVDVAPEMVRRGKERDPRLDLRVFDGSRVPCEDGSFDLCLLITVLTCVPSNAGQQGIVGEIRRVLRPGGLLFVSDLRLQMDERNQARYLEFADEFGVFGVFRTEDAVCRHHDMGWIRELLSVLDIEWERNISTTTMNGHEAEAFQILARNP
jgi:SAM-dependent methyltransferase